MGGNIVKLGWSFLPEIGMVLRHGMPKMVLMIQFSGDDEAALAQHLAAVKRAIDEFDATHAGVQIRLLRDEAEAEKYWTIRRQSFALLHGAVKGKDTAPFIDDFIVKPEYVKEVLPKVNAILEPYKKDLIYTIAGHPGNGNFHIIPLMDLKDARVRALIPEISQKIYQLIFQYHGSITAEHNDGLIRTPYLEEMYGPDIEKLFIETKKIFDPANLFNPGKKFGGNFSFILDHIIPDEKRFECGAAWLDATDDEVLPRTELHFDPVVRSHARPIPRPEALSDDALQAQAPHHAFDLINRSRERL